jgi:hypothetical protein
MKLREALELLRPDHPHAHELELALLAVALLEGTPLDVADPDEVTVLLRAAELTRSGADGAAALERARAEHAAGDFYAPSLDETLRLPALFEAEGIGDLRQPADGPDAPLVLLERHEIGPHAIELWGTPSVPEPAPPPAWQPCGEPIGTCVICTAGVGDQDPTFAHWTGSNWRYSGYGLKGSKRIPEDAPLLCCSCAVRAKYRLIEPPLLDGPKLTARVAKVERLVDLANDEPPNPEQGDPS